MRQEAGRNDRKGCGRQGMETGIEAKIGGEENESEKERGKARGH